MNDDLQIFYAFPPLLGFLVLFFISLLSLARGKRNPTTILFAGVCFLGALINADVALVSLIPDEDIALKVDRGTYFFFVFSLPIFMQFVHTFVGVTKRAWLEYVSYSISIVILFFIPSPLFIKDLTTYSFGRIADPGPVYLFFAAITGLTVCYCLGVLISSLHRTRNNELKNRIKYILGGIGLSIILLILNIFPILGYAIYPPGNFSFVPAIFLAFGVLKYDLLDINSVIRRSLFYFILTLLLTFICIAIISCFNSLLVSTGKSTVALPFILALFMVLLYDPLHQKVRRGIDNFFFRGRYDYQQLLKKTSGEMATLLSVEQISRLLTTSITAALQTNHCILLHYDRDSGFFLPPGERGEEDSSGKMIHITSSHPLVPFLEHTAAPLSRISVEQMKQSFEPRSRILQLFQSFQVSTVVPLLTGNRLVGMIMLGDKKSGELLVHEDRELLITLANQSVTAIENAHAYEEIKALNADLEKKVAERTASLLNTLEEKEKTQKQLIQSESLAAIGQLVAGAAHELNNPLASASSLIQSSMESVAEGKTPNHDEVLDDLAFSLKELKRMGDIVRSLLDLSRKTQTYVEPVLVNLAIDDALRVLYNQYKYLPLEIVKNYDENLPPIEGNFANLGQVFINIIKNALQSLPEGVGRIILTTEYNSERNSVQITCRDTGKGIPDLQQKDIFKPFFTTKEVGEGTGLGLYISHEIIKRHGGNIDVTSTEGEGTSLTIELPCQRRT